MRSAFRLLLLVCLAAGGADDTISRIAAVEASLPWFWSVTAEGLSDIPYTYHLRTTRRILSRDRKELPPAEGASPLANWRSLHFERIPLDFGAQLRCLSADGRSPCADEWNQEFERQHRRRDALNAEEKRKIEATREERRARRRSFWRDFPAAFRFQSAGSGQLQFTRPRGSGLLGAIDGRLWFDPATHEVTRMEYDLLKDIDEPFGKLPKGARFEISMAKVDGHYMPERTFVRRRLTKDGAVDERTSLYSDFKWFVSESNVQFVDK